jgi:hypothetical protein
MDELKDLEVNEVKPEPEYDFDEREMMRYRTNGLSYKLGLGGMAFSMFGAFICLNSMNPNSFQVILIILLNVVILLGGFLAAEKVKAYSSQGAIAQIVFGGVCAARILYIPLILVINYAKYMSSVDYNEETGKLVFIDQAKAEEAKNYLGATIISKYEGTVANAYLPASGYFRGISAMVLFALAAACFIAAGIIGYKRAKTLESYMNSLAENN